MARKNESPQKAAMREMMRSYFKENDIGIRNGMANMSPSSLKNTRIL